MEASRGVRVPWDEAGPIKGLGGASSKVFRALHRDGKHQVAVRYWCDLDRERLEWMRQRVALGSRVLHPALAGVECCLAPGNDELWVVSEYVAGPTLEEWIASGQELSLDSSAELVRRVSLGAHAAIRAGITHQAIQPSNLVIWRHSGGADPRLEIKLIDLAMPTRPPPALPRLAEAHFMAPETLVLLLDEWDPTPFLDARANVFSCGALLYRLVTGVLPFNSPTLHELANTHLGGTLIPPRSRNLAISPALECVIIQALEVPPARRFRNPGELANALAAALKRPEREKADRSFRP